MNFLNVLSLITSIPKNKKGWKTFAFVGGGTVIIMCIWSVFLALINFNSGIELKQAGDTAPSEMMKSNSVFEFKDVDVIACYIKTKDNNSNPLQYHFLIAYNGNDGKAHTASIDFTEKRNEMLNKMLELAENNNHKEITFFARAKKFNHTSLYEDYKSAVERYCNDYENLEFSELRLDYCFDTSEQLDAFAQKEKEELKDLIKTCLFFSVLGIILVVLGLVKRK
ncbi:MAG: hypothetical protein K2J55_03335 [Eubacterium sp.]|nr:hypothetical protein [Eubacterium sp.]